MDISALNRSLFSVDYDGIGLLSEGSDASKRNRAIAANIEAQEGDRNIAVPSLRDRSAQLQIDLIEKRVLGGGPEARQGLVGAAETTIAINQDMLARYEAMARGEIPSRGVTPQEIKERIAIFRSAISAQTNRLEELTAGADVQAEKAQALYDKFSAPGFLSAENRDQLLSRLEVLGAVPPGGPDSAALSDEEAQAAAETAAALLAEQEAEDSGVSGAELSAADQAMQAFLAADPEARLIDNLVRDEDKEKNEAETANLASTAVSSPAIEQVAPPSDLVVNQINFETDPAHDEDKQFEQSA